MTISPDRIIAAVQAMLDAHGDGFQVSQLVICMGLERVVNGEIEATAWVWSPPSQPDWMTAGLLEAGMVMRETAELDD